MAVSVFGIRHHGPGSARSLRSALADLDPDAVLVEGPPDAAAILPLAASPEMEPPVALLVYAPDQPRHAVFYPFAAFSPEWQAIRHAQWREVPVRFVDLPVANWLADGRRDPPFHGDPLGALSRAAGYDDAERWWEDVVEHRTTGAFDAVAEAMAALREGTEATGREARREAAMRQGIRAAVREGFQRVAVVCGAWHVPALAAAVTATADAALLRRLPKRKVAATWVPWTNGRLALASGYGAGVTSPGWYHHLFTTDDDVVPRWLVKVAGLLREDGLVAPPGSVIDAVRLADTLAALRGRPVPGLEEVTEASRAVLAGGSEPPMALIAERLVVGDVLGAVPPETPAVPLQADLTRQQRRLRMRPEAFARRLDLDLRRPIDRDRSQLLHRLALLGIDWGEPEEVSGKAGTFHEVWELQWRPELAVDLIVAGVWGTTVASAAGAVAEQRAASAVDLASLTAIVEATLLAGLPEATTGLMRTFTDRAALDTDVTDLMGALPALARVVRYGNVRGTDVGAVATVVDGLVTRIAIGLPLAVASLDDQAARAMAERVGAVQGAIALLDRPDLRDPWHAALARVLDRSGLHGLVAGRATRLLLDAGSLAAGDAATRMSAALSGEAPTAAAWAEGFLAGSGLVLLHDPALLAILDRWLADVSEDRFTGVLPLLRRTFATFADGERRQIGEAVARLDPHAAPRRPVDDIGDLDHERAVLVLPMLARLLGVDRDGDADG